MAAIVTSVNRVDGIYEPEVAVRMVLVANNNLIVYTNAATDPYTNNNASALAVAEPGQSGCGHRQLPTTTSATSSARAVADWPPLACPVEPASRLKVKPGHRLRWAIPSTSTTWRTRWAISSAAITPSTATLAPVAAATATLSTAYEPGSGSTIMAYAGICGADDLQPNSDPYFHTVSFDEIVAYTHGRRSAMRARSPRATGNNPPVPNAGTGGFTIPANTPFALTGSATDADGHPLTYKWEEFDLGVAGPPGSASNPPFFRSLERNHQPHAHLPQALQPGQQHLAHRRGVA